MAFDMLDAIVTVTNPVNNEKLKIRIGLLSDSLAQEDNFLSFQVVIVVPLLLASPESKCLAIVSLETPLPSQIEWNKLAQ